MDDWIRGRNGLGGSAYCVGALSAGEIARSFGVFGTGDVDSKKCLKSKQGRPHDIHDSMMQLRLRSTHRETKLALEETWIR